MVLKEGKSKRKIISRVWWRISFFKADNKREEVFMQNSDDEGATSTLLTFRCITRKIVGPDSSDYQMILPTARSAPCQLHVLINCMLRDE